MDLWQIGCCRDPKGDLPLLCLDAVCRRGVFQQRVWRDLYLCQRQLVGAIHILFRETRDIPILVPRRFAAIENLIVSKAFQRTGIGRALMERAHQWAMDQGITGVELNVWEFNAGARAFYAKLGYETTRRSMSKSLVQREA